MEKAIYKHTILADICFEYYPLSDYDSVDCKRIVNHDHTEEYEEQIEIVMDVTPQMLVNMLKSIYGNNGFSKQQQPLALVNALESNPFLFDKLCAEIIGNPDLYESCDNAYDIGPKYDFLTSTQEFKNKVNDYINSVISEIGELAIDF